MQPNIQVKLPSKLVNLFIGKRKKKETSAKRISFPLGTFNPPLPEYAWTELITRFPTKKKKSFDKFFFFRPKKKMKNDTWFDKLEVGKLFMLNDDINEVYFIWVKISPNKAIKVWDCETLHSDFTGTIDTKKPLLHYFSIYPKELELNVPEKVKQWFQR